jgi:CrcB protein
MPVLLQIALGGALGAGLRHLTGAQVARLLGTGFPWGTLAVNLIGCFAMGLVTMLVVRRPELGLQGAAPFVATGLLGGFTTFSAFSLETFQLVERGRPLLAVGYVAASLAGTLAAFALAVVLTRPAPGP